MANSHDSLNIISANVRGLLTNIGDLTYSFIIPHKPDIVATVETFFNDQVPDNYGKVDGYSNWYRRDRKEGQKGGIAVCLKKRFACAASRCKYTSAPSNHVFLR